MIIIIGSFPFVPPPPSLLGAYYLQPPGAGAIFLHNDLICNDTCSVTGGSITYWGGGGAQTEKILIIISGCMSTAKGNCVNTIIKS